MIADNEKLSGSLIAIDEDFYQIKKNGFSLRCTFDTMAEKKQQFFGKSVTNLSN